MEFKNGYNFIYEKKVEAARKLFASKIGRPDLSDEAIDLGLTDEEIKSAKLFYETKESIVVSTSGIPTANDKAISLTINGEPVIGPSGDTPTALFKLKVGDKFVDLHFDTSTIPNKDDFNWTEGDGFISVIAAFKWYQRGSSEDVDGNAFAAQYLPAGTEMDGVVLDEDFLMIIDFSGRPIYTSNAEIAIELFGGHSAEIITHDGWLIGSFREFIETYDLDWDLSEKSYGELIAQIPGDNDYIPDYTQIANGKIYGFKQSDYYKQPGPTPASLTPFTNGQTIKGFDFGNVKNGDVSAELDTFLLGLSLNVPTVLVSGDGDVSIVVIHSDDIGADHEEGGILFTSDRNITFLYSTLDAELEGERHLDKGFQNIEDGKYTLQYPSTLYDDGGVNKDITGWNGILVGAVEEEPSPTPTQPFYVGQVMEAGDIIHIDTSKTDELLAHLESIDWEGSSDPMIQYGMYPMLCSLNNDGLIIVAMNWTDMIPGCYALVCGTMSGDAAIIYNSVTAEGYEAGWHGLDSNNNIILNNLQGTPGYIEAGLPIAIDTIYDIGTPSWNGGVIGFAGHGPEPTPPPAHPMLPFEVGDTITDGQTIYIDRHKEQELIDYMEAVTEGQDNVAVEILNHTNGRILWIHKNSSGYKLRLGGTKLIYSTYNDLEYGHKGWNDVDINGYYVVNLNDYSVDALTVAEVNDPEGAGITWNGNILGK